MPPVHYLFEWIAQEDQVQSFCNLLDASTQFGCQTRFISGNLKTNREGYYFEAVVLDAPSQKAADQFLDASVFKNIIRTLERLSAEDRAKLETYSYRDPEFIGRNRELEEVLFETAFQNKALQTLLEKSSPLYFSYDWVVPSQLFANPLEAEFICWIDWNYKFASSIMFDIVTAAWPLGIGREIRLGKDFTSYDGLLGLRLIARLFSRAELSQYLQRHRIKIFDQSGWKLTSADDFFMATHLQGTTLPTFYNNCIQKSEYNKELRDNS